MARPRSALSTLAGRRSDVDIHVGLPQELEGLGLLQLLQQANVPPASDLGQPGFPQLVAAHESGVGE